jgi:hypothetical protein
MDVRGNLEPAVFANLFISAVAIHGYTTVLLSPDARQYYIDMGWSLPRAANANSSFNHAFIEPVKIVSSLLLGGPVERQLITFGDKFVSASGVYISWSPPLPSDGGCSPLPSTTPDLSDKVVILPSGGCSIVQKLKNVAVHSVKYILADEDSEKRTSGDGTYGLLVDFVRDFSPPIVLLFSGGASA